MTIEVQRRTGDDEVYGLIHTGLFAARPAPEIADRLYFCTDTLVLYRDTGAAWVEVSRGETATRLAQLAERAHGSLTGVMPAQHHARYTNVEAIAAIIANVRLDQLLAPNAPVGLNNQLITSLLGITLSSFSELTIAGGIITVTRTCHTVDTQGDIPSDDLDTINGGGTVNFIILRAENDARTVVVKHNTGNIWLKSQYDIELNDIGDSLMLIWDGTRWFDTGPEIKMEADTDPKLAGNLDGQNNDIANIRFIQFTGFIEVTISGGAITATQTCHSIDTEGNAPIDDLDTINGGGVGSILFIHPVSEARDVMVKHGVGNISLQGMSDILLNHVTSGLFLIRTAPFGWWVDVTLKAPAVTESTWSVWSDFTHFTQLVAGTGSTVRVPFYTYLRSGAVAGGRASSYIQHVPHLPFVTHDVAISFSFYPGSSHSANGKKYMRISTTNDAVELATGPFGPSGFGFEIEDDDLIGVFALGANRYTVAMVPNLTSNRLYIAEAIHIAGHRVDFYLERTLVGTLAYSFPAAANNWYLQAAVNNFADNALNDLTVERMAVDFRS